MTNLSYIAKVWSSLFPILNCGAVAHCIRYMRFLRATYKGSVMTDPLPFPLSLDNLPYPNTNPTNPYPYSNHNSPTFPLQS